MQHPPNAWRLALGLRPALHLKPPQRLAISFGASPRLAFKTPPTLGD